MNYALLDDQPSFHSEFRELTKEYITIDNCSYYFNSDSLFSDVKKRPEWNLNVLFLDIELQGESGIDIARKIYEINPSIIIIFLTNKNNLVYEAFGLNVFRFIYKPMFKTKINSTFISIINEIEMQKNITFKSGNSYISLAKKEIVLVSRELRKVYIYTSLNKKFETNFKTIKDAYDTLDSDLFTMINRSEIVNLNYIVEINDSRLKLKYLKNSHYISRDRLTCIRDKWRKLYV
ncbi:MAG: LytR/AlgR family response regulator transcription factor [Erysipelotrichaceae bacterium]